MYTNTPNTYAKKKLEPDLFFWKKYYLKQGFKNCYSTH